MKIAMIDPSLFTWPYDKALIDALGENGHKILFYTKHLSKKDQGKGDGFIREFFYYGLQFDLIKKIPHPLFLALKGMSHVFCMAMLWVTLKLEKPDVIHFQWVPLPIVDKLFIPLFKKIAPVILTVHDSSPFNGNPKSKLQGMGATDIMKIFDGLIVHTHNAVITVNSYGIGKEKINHIPHGVLGTDKIKTFSSDDSHKPMNDPVVALLFGHLKPYKGADILIESLGKMHKSIRKKLLVKIVGKPQMDVEPLFELAKKLNVEENIQWDLRFINDNEVADVFSSADITVMPYREIDASGVLMVALSIGKPIIASKIGLFNELLENEKHGYLIQQENPAELAKALESLIENKEMRDDMGRNVITLGQSIPTWSDISDKTVTLYKKLIG